MKKISVEQYTQLAEREVWNKMIAEENIVMNRPDLAVVQQVMGVMIQRIKFNLQYIYDALQNYGFKFTDFDEPPGRTNPLIFEQEDITQELFRLENDYTEFGFFPLSILEFYRHIQQVDFRGYFPTKKCRTFLDPLMILPMETCFKTKAWYDEDTEDGVMLSFDDAGKENEQSSGHYGIELTINQQIDTRLLGFFYDPNKEIQEDIMFLDYLRLCFKWAGFPGLEFATRLDVSDYIWDVVSNIVPYLKPI